MRYRRFILNLVLLTLPGILSYPPEGTAALPSPAAAKGQVIFQEVDSAASGATGFYTTTISIPTYPYTDYLHDAYNPTYNITYPALDWGSYAASGPTPSPQEYTLLVMANDYLTVTVMPELGGRVYQLIDKTTGENYLYQNPVIKPTHWGPPEQGWWLAAGGIEWCLPVEEHGYEWGIPWNWTAIVASEGVTITVSDTDTDDRLRATVDLFLPGDRAYLAVTPHLENPTEEAIDYKFWLNAALAPGAANKPTAGLQFIFNADEMSVHSTGDRRLPGAAPTTPTGPDYRFSWPVYNGVDFSLLGNWREWLGFFEYPQAADDFVGLYSHDAGAGVIRVFPHTVARGAKGFGYGWSGPIDWHQWTDEDSGGVEIQGGVAPTFWDMATLAPGAALSWTEVWYPVGAIGGASEATEEAALRVREDGGTLHIDLQSTKPREAGTGRLYVWDRNTCAELAQWTLPALNPGVPYQTATADLGGRSLELLAVAFVDDGEAVLAAVNDVDCLHTAPPEPHLGYGINVRDGNRVDGLVTPLGIEWVKLWEEYDGMPTTPQPQQVLFLINCGGYINDLTAWGDHVEAIAQAGLGIVDAYEICNEPNVNRFWSGQPPDPARYTEMLCAAQERIRAVDPAAGIVSGGLAPVGRIQGTCNSWSGNNCAVMDERTYLKAMLAGGAGQCMDAFGYHPYGYAYPPEQDPGSAGNGFAFRGAEVMHDILVNAGWKTMPLWATEFNWLRSPADDGVWCGSDPDYVQYFQWMEVSAQTQADYLVRALQYADAKWPWMHGIFVWNLDWHNYLSWLPCEASRYFSIRRNDGSDLGAPTPAYDALAAMARRPGLVVAPQMVVKPTHAVLLAETIRLPILATSVMVENVGYGTLWWTATVSPNGALTPTLPVTSGIEGERVWITVDTAALDVGFYTGAITVTAVSTGALNPVQQVTVSLHVVPELQRVYLPAIMQNYASTPQYSFDYPQGPSKIGVHAISSGGTVEFVRNVHDRGAHVALVKAVSSFGYLKDVKAISPETVTIGRWCDAGWEAIQASGDPVQKAAQYMQVHMQHWAEHKDYVDYWEILNEVDPPTIEGHVWLAQFFIETMNIAEENGYRLALFSYSMGVPEWYEWQAIVETGVFARAKAGGHILSLHEYDAPRMSSYWGWPLPEYPGQDPQDPSLPRYADRGALTGRYRFLYRDFLIPRNEVIPLAITETNLAIDDPEERGEIFVEEMSWYDDRLREDSYVIGMAIFTLGGRGMGWDDFDYFEFLPELEERIVLLKGE